MESLSFDGLTALYNQTRTFDPTCFGRVMDCLADRFPPRQFPAVLEPGVGTGRIALPLAERGYQVTGLDISEQMLGLCAAQCRVLDATGSICCLRADAACLPLSARAFDLCVAVHLFYFIGDWRGAVREMLRVLRPGGALVLLHTGFGTEVPRLNERYQELAQRLGYTFPTYGVRSTSEVVEYAASLGCGFERVEEPAWEWTAHLRLEDALHHLRARAYSFTKDVPEDVHMAAVDSLQQAVTNTAGATSGSVTVPNRISAVILSLPGEGVWPTGNRR